MWLTIRLAFQPKWTERIHAEWMENLLQNRPDLTRTKLERTRDLLSEFPRSTLEPLGIRAVHPDAFLCELFEKDPSLFIAAIHDQLDALRNPPHTLDGLLRKFRLDNIVKLSERLEAYRDEF